jgi:hypothetical protein
VVCGHIHCAEIRQFGGITYYNDGDWVESCTALVESLTGEIAIVDWVEETGGHAHALPQLGTSAASETTVPSKVGA